MCVLGKVRGRTNGWSGLGVSEWRHASVSSALCRRRASSVLPGPRQRRGPTLRSRRLETPGRAGFLELQRRSDGVALFQGMFYIRLRDIRCGLDGLSITVSPGLISRPPSAGRIFMTRFSMVMVWTWHLALASLETQLSRSAVEPLLVIVR